MGFFSLCEIYVSGPDFEWDICDAVATSTVNERVGVISFLGRVLNELFYGRYVGQLVE